MKNQEFEINSYWKRELGNWSEKENKYVNREFSPVTEKVLKIVDDPEKNILKFEGGPTGYESYYYTDLTKTILEKPKSTRFCICAGTINSWPNCTVKMDDFREILFQIEKRKKEKN